MALEELENMAKDEGKDGAKRERQLEAKIRDLEDELARGGGRGGRGGALGARGRDLQKRCAMLEADVKDLESELNAEKRATAELEEKLEEAEKKAKSFKRENEALQADMKELLAQMESSSTQVRKCNFGFYKFATILTRDVEAVDFSAASTASASASIL